MNSLEQCNSARSACFVRVLPVGLNPASLLFLRIRLSRQYRTSQRDAFEHYELVTREDGQPVQLGRGAMGVTYKAFDVDLRYPVTPKIISERYLGDESAHAPFFARSPGGGKGAPFERRLGVTPGQNWEQLLLRDSVLFYC